MKKILYLILMFSLGILSNAISQETIKYSVCLLQSDIDPNGNNVFMNDGPYLAGQQPQLAITDSECYFYDVQNDIFSISSTENCCDTTFVIEYIYPGHKPQDKYVLSLTVKCGEPIPKPNCTNIYLNPPDDVGVGGDPAQGDKLTYYACDSTPVTYFVDDAPGQVITWNAGTVNIIQPTGINNNTVSITWPNEGIYTLTVDVDGDMTSYCIEVLDSPSADFIFGGTCGCKNTDISFISTGVGGNEFFWDFGDGNFGLGATTTHQYSTSGIYNVTLIVVQDNFDDEMNPLCCCSDTISYPIEILNLEGPPIYWISTLCEGDTTKYWTDAVGCVYTWIAVDSDGVNVLPPGTVTSNDTLCVPWGAGPFGQVSLTVTGCTDMNYCPKPTIATIPIVEAISTISGKDTVCYSSNEFYSAPKWPTVEYTWEIVPPSAGTITGSGNSISIIWADTTITATIIVNYHSDFLGGIVGHEPADCAGYAELDVRILPRFELVNPEDHIFCIGDTVSLEARPVAPATIYPIFFNWEVDPPIGPVTTTVLPATNLFEAVYTDPGNYKVKVYPSAPNPYCNDTVTYSFEIIEVPKMDAIDGPKEVCKGDIVTYFGLTSVPGTEFYWDAQGGSIQGPNNGNPVTVEWNTNGPYTIIAYQQLINAPECASDTISCVVTRKVLGSGFTINGSPACTNEIMTYNISPLPSDPDIIYSWEIQDSLNGSVVSGDTGPVVNIQWNNTQGTDTIFCNMILCDDTLTVTKVININQAAPVTIIQNMPYCIGATGVTLTASTSGASYMWTTPPPSPFPLNAQSVNVTAPGNYIVVVTEPNGCSAVANFEVFENGLPNVNLTSPDLLGLCTQDMGSTVELHALVGTYSYDWFKSANGGAFLPDPETSPILTHTNSGNIGFCNYYYVATDLVSGCSDQSNFILVTQDSCFIDTTLCMPDFYTSDVSNTPFYPNCDIINFTTTNSLNVTITGWNFGDPPFNSVYTGSISAPTHDYDEAGYYIVSMLADVPNEDSTAFCSISDTTLVCVPLAADFDYTYDCGEYTFTSTSSWITGAAPISYQWDFDDGNSGTGITTTHTYTTFSPPDFNVRLVITNADGCISEKIIPIEVLPPPTADIIVMPPDTCVNKPFMFSNANNLGIVGWDWEFGDMSTNGGPVPKHAYSTAGTYMVTLTVTDENGCTNSDVESVIVHPSATTGPITYAGDLFLCPGESLILNAPSGDQYIWTTGASTSAITVNMTGTYGVTVTDINGCTFIPDSVDVVVYPPVDATITGSNIICDEGCTTLKAVSGAGYSYQWIGDFGPLPATGGGTTVKICFDQNNPITNVDLIITDGNMCTASTSIPIEYGDGPEVLISAMPSILCAGTVNVLTATSPLPSATFDWSTGDVGPTISVILEGTYRVTATDPISGCSRDTFINVNPLPDLCIVPYGCYTACDPDTICAPSGLDEYEWYFNGTLQPMYSGLECIIVTESGAYNFAGTNEFNCEAFSDTLYLEMIPCCRPGDTDISAFLPTGQEDCCYSFNYSVNQDIFYSLDLHSDDADLGLVINSVNPPIGIGSSLPTLNSFHSAPVPGNPLPQGPISGFATICLENVTSSPVEVIADWRGEDGEILCSDTLLLECLVEPDCIYVQNDSIYCDSDGNLVYDVTICNPLDAAYSIAYIDFLELTPSGVMLNPSEIDLGGNPLLPGDCIDLSLSILGNNLANQDLCYNLVGHQYDPNENPGSLCCSVDTTYCVFIPGCTPCDMVYVSGIDSSELGECCYDVMVNNYFDDMTFSVIDLCVLTQGATFDIFNPLSSPWDIVTLNTTTATLDYNDGTITNIPFGDTTLPTICVGDNDTPNVDVEIKWMSGGVIFCRDTISLLCPGDCGYMSDTSLVCGPKGTWIFTGYITNTSLDTMDSAYIDFGQDVLNAYDTSINLNGLLPGQTYGPFSISMSGTTGAGPELCIITTLHANDHDDNHEDCCEFKTVITVPECEEPVDCMCGPDFEDQVAMGMNCDPVGSSYTYNFSPKGNFGDCDKIVWDFKKQQISYMTIGNQEITHTFPSPGEYQVCMTIVRTQPNGKTCKEKFCKDVSVGEVGLISVYPNPVTNQVNLVLEKTSFAGMASIEIMDSNNRKCKSMEVEMSDDNITSIDLSNIKTGVYMMRIRMDDKIHTKRILIVR